MFHSCMCAQCIGIRKKDLPVSEFLATFLDQWLLIKVQVLPHRIMCRCFAVPYAALDVVPAHNTILKFAWTVHDCALKTC